MAYSERDGDHLWPADGEPRTPWIALCDMVYDLLLEHGAWHVGRSNMGDVPAVYGHFDEDKKVDADVARVAVRSQFQCNQLRVEKDSYGWVVVVYPSPPGEPPATD